jgi:glycosyltransferase involved in cell wall biosynthesis
MTAPPELSVVIPVYNESPNVRELYRELTDTLGRWGRSYELVVVDDGSTDDTFDQLAALQANDSGAAGHPPAPQLRTDGGLFGGLRHARRTLHRDRGRRLAERSGRTAKDDRPDRTGADIVCGWRKDRRDHFITRRIPSMIA